MLNLMSSLNKNLFVWVGAVCGAHKPKQLSFDT